ncbi:hypothetical protein GOV13_03675 [Candidatus Pacearchaeota archaeon]|nr:hypothetical protein [Candidatus Pacearchaeota archaeon]
MKDKDSYTLKEVAEFVSGATFECLTNDSTASMMGYLEKNMPSKLYFETLYKFGEKLKESGKDPRLYKLGVQLMGTSLALRLEDNFNSSLKSTIDSAISMIKKDREARD